MAINKAMPAASRMQAVPRQSMVCFTKGNKRSSKEMKDKVDVA